MAYVTPHCKRLMEAGMNMELVTYEKLILPSALVDDVKAIRKRSLKPDDIILVSHPKSGTHWTWEILKMLAAGKAEYANHWQNSSFLELRTEEDLEELESPRVLHTHLLPSFMPDSLWKLKCKIVYVKRNPKDVLVSGFNQSTKQSWPGSDGRPGVSYTGTWEDWVNWMWLEGLPPCSWFNHINDWRNITQTRQEADICYVTYEDMQQDCMKVVKKLAEHLERPLSEKIYSDIVEACSFQKLKHASEHTKDQTFHTRWQDGSEGYFRKGIVGDWKNWFTVAQNENFDRIYKEKMKSDI